MVDRDYATQRIVYALAALRGGAPRAEVAYCFLERPDAPVQQAFTPADAPALAERLQELAAGVIARQLPGHAHAAPRPVRRLPRPRDAVLVPRGADAAARLSGSTTPPA